MIKHHQESSYAQVELLTGAPFCATPAAMNVVTISTIRVLEARISTPFKIWSVHL